MWTSCEKWPAPGASFGSHGRSRAIRREPFPYNSASQTKRARIRSSWSSWRVVRMAAGRPDMGEHKWDDRLFMFDIVWEGCLWTYCFYVHSEIHVPLTLRFRIFGLNDMGMVSFRFKILKGLAYSYCGKSDRYNWKTGKRSVPGLRTWSPTVLLAWLESSWLPRSDGIGYIMIDMTERD